MKFIAKITKNERISQSETDAYHLKIFADVLEAIMGAVFIDSGCNLSVTYRVFLKIFEPYLYFYGNLATLQNHPKTKVLQFWN